MIYLKVSFALLSFQFVAYPHKSPHRIFKHRVAFSAFFPQFASAQSENKVVSLYNSISILCKLGMSRSGFFALETESESSDFEPIPIPSPDLIFL